MIQFLQENLGEIFVIIFMAVWWMGNGFFTIKGDVNSLDQKRIASGMEAMTDDEKQLVTQMLRMSVKNNFVSVVIAGIVALIVASFF